MLEIKSKYKKIISLICLLTICLVVITGCGQKKDKNGSEMSDDGRSYGGQINADMKDIVSTAFFDVTVDEAVKYDTFQFEDGLYQADSGLVYLSVKLTIKNTYEENLSMSITDFTLDYDGNKSKDIITGYGKADLKQDDYMENLFTLKKGETITKSILFTVADKDVYTLNYKEYYEDKFEGNNFQIKVKPEKKSMETGSTSEGQQDEATTETQPAEQQKEEEKQVSSEE